jgi:hypothetical protein
MKNFYNFMYGLLLMAVGFTGKMQAQSVNIPYGGLNEVACGQNVTLYDHAGTGYYSNYAYGYTVLHSNIASTISLSGSYNLENGYDYLRIYSGIGASGTIAVFLYWLWRNDCAIYGSSGSRHYRRVLF